MNDNYNGIPIKDEYIPRHAANYIKNYNTNNYNNFNNGDNKKEKKNITVKKKKRKIKKWVWNSLLIIFLLVICISVYKLIDWNKDNKDTSDIIDEINNPSLTVKTIGHQ